MINPLHKKVLILAVRAGEIMMKSGAEIYRVEDTIERICKACKIPYVEVFAMQTGIFVSLDSGDDNSDMYTYIKRIRGGGDTDLTKISEINRFSREFTTTDLSVDAGMKRLKGNRSYQTASRYRTPSRSGAGRFLFLPDLWRKYARLSLRLSVRRDQLSCISATEPL